MKEDELESLIEAVSRKHLPACPGNFDANVLRTIRLHGHADDGVIGWLGYLIMKGGFVVSAVALTVFATTLVSSLAAPALAHSNREAAGKALGFDTITEVPRFHLGE
jgi:hypothetical protein